MGVCMQCVCVRESGSHSLYQPNPLTRVGSEQLLDMPMSYINNQGNPTIYSKLEFNCTNLRANVYHHNKKDLSTQAVHFWGNELVHKVLGNLAHFPLVSKQYKAVSQFVHSPFFAVHSFSFLIIFRMR